MDRALSKDLIIKRRRKTFLKLFFALLAVAAVIIFIINMLRTRVDPNDLLVSVADEGTVENSFVTNGLVEPYYQELLTASLSADILEIRFVPGDKVTPSDTIFIPDMSELLNDKKSIDHEIALKQNSIRRNREELNKNRIRLMSNLKMDSIKIEHLKSELEKEKHLFEIGGGSRQKVEQAEIDYQLESINSENQRKEFESFKRLQKLDLESMELELQLKQQERNKITDRISKAYVQPKINGVITSLLVEPGQHVTEGQTLAHVADAEHFKVEGTISSRYANKIFLGQEALVLVNDSLLKGHLSAISPSVENGSINYTVNLDNASSSLLRPKQQVEVRLVVSVSPQTVRITNGDCYFGPGPGELFVLNGDRLEKRKVRFGGASFDYVEIVSGVKPGETVVISKAFNTKYKHYNSLKCTD